ncbi:uncharacterized protein TNCV_5046071 [Trichonephila clavipes]|uniref:Uncharacterized protein n=1 Tax=Trichonephila clavipes TaxID=2585209 RepID=A0A8X6WHN2_TRICX|nr:uncharacterized protein TNCV_5046071 [Trichonephila clavipes]
MPVVSRSFEHHTGDRTVWLISTPILREDTWGWSGASLFSFSQPHERTYGYLEYPLAVKILYIYKRPCLLRESNPGPAVQQSASLIAIPYGRLRTRGHGLTPLRVKEDIEDVSSELGNGSYGLHSLDETSRTLLLSAS